MGIIDTGMDHFGIATAGVGARGLLRLQYQHFATGLGQLAGTGQPHHTGADHHTIDSFTHRLPSPYIANKFHFKPVLSIIACDPLKTVRQMSAQRRFYTTWIASLMLVLALAVLPGHVHPDASQEFCAFCCALNDHDDALPGGHCPLPPVSGTTDIATAPADAAAAGHYLPYLSRAPPHA